MVRAGFVLSFGYWCTNFLVIQRAMAADSMNRPAHPAHRRLPQDVPPVHRHHPASPPGARQLAPASTASRLTPPPFPNYNLVITTLMASSIRRQLGVGLTGLVASFMSGMAGNVTAFNTVWTYDIYQTYIRRNAPDRTISTSDAPTVVGVVLSIGAAYIATRYDNIMDLLQLVFGFVNAPLFATFLLGMFWKRGTGHAAFSGLVTARWPLRSPGA